MKQHYLSRFCLSLGLALTCLTAHAEDVFEKPIRIEADGKVIDVITGHAAPYVIDFDGDGIRDLLVGEFGRGSFPTSRLPDDPKLRKMGFAESKLRVYRNIGTNDAPLYKKFEYLSAGNEHASIPSTCCISFSPYFVDYDADGDLDILSGSYTGEVYFFERLESGGFAQGKFLTVADGSPLKCSISIAPEAIDMDGDGDLDLVIGSRTSGVFVITNKGTRKAPVWSAESKPLKTAAGKLIKGSNAHHADWDGDGIRDLILGSEWGEAVWHRNIGTNNKPRYGEQVVLIPKGKYVEIEAGDIPTRPGSRTKVHVTDYNGDGIVDLLVGDVQWHWKTLAPLTPAEEAEKKALKPKYEAAKEAYYKVIEERNSYVRKKEGIPQEVLDRFDKAGGKFQPFSKKWASYDRRESKTHGFVWLYLRKPNGEGGRQNRKAANASPTDRANTPTSRVSGYQSETAIRGPVSFQVSAVPVKGKPRQLRLTATLQIQDGWHTYAVVPEDGAFQKTQLTQRWPKGVEPLGDWSTKSTPEPVPTNPQVSWFANEAVFDCCVVCESYAADVQIEMAYQACNDRLCLPPGTLMVTLRLPRE